MIVGSNNILIKKGTFAIIESLPIKNAISINGFSDNISVSKYAGVLKELSISYDNQNWSEYLLATNLLFKSIDVSKTVYLKFKYTVIENPYNEFIEIKNIILNVDYKTSYSNLPVAPNVDFGGFELCTQNVFDNVNRELLESNDNKEATLNYLLNRDRGIDVMYFRNEPDLDTVDVFLNEYSIKGITEYKEIKIMVADGNIPDEKSQYDVWGISSESFDAQISIMYWKSIFGDIVTPRNEDVVIIHQIKRAYKVRSNYRGYGNSKSELYYAIHLDTYDLNSGIKKSDDVLSKLDDQFIPDRFEEQRKFEMDNATGKHQGKISTLDDDKYRSFVHFKISIKDEPLTFSKQIIFNTYYDFCDIIDGEMAIEYKDVFSMDKSIAISMWLKLSENSVVFKSTNMTISFVDNKFVVEYLGMKPIKFEIPEECIDNWKGYCLNINEEFNTTTLFILSKDSPNNTTRFDSTLSQIYSKTFKSSPQPFIDDVASLIAGKYNISNVRIWKNSIPEEYLQIAVLSDRVTNAGATYIIDNCSHQFNLGKIGVGRLM